VGLQTGNVSMVALAVGSDPVLREGVYLHWFVDPQLGFPPLGFDVFRRVHRTGAAQKLDFTAEAPRVLPRNVQLGTATWSTGSDVWTARFREETTNQGLQTVLEPPPPSGSAITCRFAPNEGPCAEWSSTLRTGARDSRTARR
jgi:hypothetical protein